MKINNNVKKPLPPPPPPPPAPKAAAKPAAAEKPVNAVAKATARPTTGAETRAPATAETARTSSVAAPTAPAARTPAAASRPLDTFTRQTAQAPAPVATPSQGQSPLAPSFTALDPASATTQAAAKAARAAMPQQLPQVSAQDSFSVKSAAQDELGTTHVRMDRAHNGIPVFGEQAVGHVGKDGSVSVTGLMGKIPAEMGKGAPKMTADQAAQRIAEQFGLGPGAVTGNDMQRVIAQGTDGKYRDTWMIQNFFAGAHQLNAQVSTEDGKVSAWGHDHGIIDDAARERADRTVREQEAQQQQQLPFARGVAGAEPQTPPAVLGNDRSEYSGMVEIGGTPMGGGKERMLDTTRGQGIETVDNQNRVQDPAQPPVTMTDNNGAWGEATDPKAQQAAVDAQYGSQMTYDFYKNVLGRDSIDGQGQKLLSVVNTRLEDESGRLAPNAFWDGEKMTYGIGDGRRFGNLTDMDIAGHEISHGVTEATAGLIYRNESGGINESLSDIMGTGVEWYASQHNSNIKFDYNIGENAFTPTKAGDALRYMSDPTKDGSSLDHYSQMSRFPKDSGVGPNQSDNGGVHSSSGIMNNAFYLMAQGGTNRTSGQGVDKPMGIEDSLKIFGRAQQYYMTPNSTFAFARESTLRAASDLYGKDSPQVAAVRQAWTAVGVNDAPAVS